MAKDTRNDNYVAPVRRLLVALFVLVLIGLFILWRIDSPRVERLRAALIDRFVPSFEWAMAPVTGLTALVSDFRSYQAIYEQNQELKEELRLMQAWREAALRLERENAQLRAINNVRLDPQLSYVTGVVLADSGTVFRQSVMINIGARDGVRDGWAAMDGLGLVGRISGVGRETARVLLLTDTSSRVPVIIQPSGQRAIVVGDNTIGPPLEFIDDRALIRAGDRVVTSGDGDVFPSDLLVGQVTEGTDGRLRVRLAADYERMEFLRLIRAHGTEDIDDPGNLIAPAPPEAVDPLEEAAQDEEEAPTDG